VKQAAALADARLELGDDPAAHALRAFVALTRRGLPTRALGVIRHDLPVRLDPEVRSDLEAARSLRGEPGARVRWLLADLLLLSGPDHAGEAREAFALAEEGPASDAPETRALAGVLHLEPDSAGFSRLVAELASGDALAPFALMRFLVRCG